jgi:hypothetical protein
MTAKARNRDWAKTLTLNGILCEINTMLTVLRFLCAAVPVLVLAISVPPAIAQTDTREPATVGAGKKRVVPRPAREPQGQIACGRYGCVRIPPNCHPEQTYDQWGNPTGSDAIICR